MAAETVRLTNFPEANLVEITKFDADEAAAQTVLTVKNNDGFAADDFIVLGRLGHEKAEVRRVASVTNADTITVTAATSFAHKKFEDITKLRGDKIRLYKATNVDGTIPTDANFSLDSTNTIEADQQYIEATVTAGGTGFWYKQTFYQSVGLTETELGDSDAVRGGDSGHYATIEDIRKEAGFMDNPELTDENIHDRRDDAESEIDGCLKSAGYTLPLSTTPSVIENITKILTAGYLLLQDYGVGADGTNKEGTAKIDYARGRLLDIKNKVIVLTSDIDGSELSSSSYMSGWPDDTTETAAETSGGGEAVFRMLKKL